jgi:hypothetical protein
MKTSLTRILLFSIIAMLSVFLLGLVDRNHVVYNKSDTEQLQEIALDFKDIPLANHSAWENTAVKDPQLLIRLSTSKLVGVQR